MIKLIVSDFDGTLMSFGASSVSAAVKQRLRQALDRGVTVAISSGRTYEELRSYLPDFEKDVYFICCDGAYYVKDGVVLYEKKIAREDLRFFSSQEDTGFPFILHGAFQNYAVGALRADTAHFRATHLSHVSDVREDVFKVTTFGPVKRLPPYCGLRTHWDGGPEKMSQYVNRFANKGTALSDLQMRLILTKYETACIGDSGNDVAMMKNAKHAICIGDRSPELRAVCNRFARSPEEALDALLAENEAR